jgi:Icc protein
MSSCCGDPRRHLEDIAAAAPAPALAASTGSLVPQDLELVTVTDTSFILTWFTGDRAGGSPDGPPAPVPTDSVVRYGTAPDRLDRVATVAGETAWHHVEVDGLTPGTTYWYQALSAGIEAAPRILPVFDYRVLDGFDFTAEPTPEALQLLALALLGEGAMVSGSPGVVTTLVPPAGALICTVALSNDLHAGEEVSGLAVGDYPPGFSQLPGQPPYPEVMAAAMVADARRRGADVLIVAGDLTSDARPVELATSRRLLDGFGTLAGPGPGSAPESSPVPGRLVPGQYVVARGNHDRPRQGPPWSDGPAAAGEPGFHDGVPATFGIDRGHLTVNELGGLRLIGLDTTTLDRAGGAIGAAQLSELESVLASDPDRPTVVFGHHPVTDASARRVISGPDFILDRPDAARLEGLYARFPGVFLHHAGHTHRNLRTSSDRAPGVEFLEVAAIKEYPGGFSLLRVYEGGYTVNFHKSSGPGALAWSQRSAGEYLGLYPSYTLGSLEDRSHVVARDLTAAAG